MGSWFRNRRDRTTNGLTTIELLVAAAASILLLATLVRMMMAGFKQRGVGEERTTGIKEAVLVSTALREDLAQALPPLAGTPLEQFVQWDASSSGMQFTTLIDGKERTVEYLSDGDAVTRTVTDTSTGAVVKKHQITVPGLKSFGPPPDVPLVGKDAVSLADGTGSYDRVFVRFRIELVKEERKDDNETGRVVETMMFPLQVNRKAWQAW